MSAYPLCGEECAHGRFCTRDRGHRGEHVIMEMWHGRMQLACTWSTATPAKRRTCP
jgi:hypothetical protein